MRTGKCVDVDEWARGCAFSNDQRRELHASWQSPVTVACQSEVIAPLTRARVRDIGSALPLPLEAGDAVEHRLTPSASANVVGDVRISGRVGQEVVEETRVASRRGRRTASVSPPG